MADQVLIALAGIGTLQLTRAAYEAALIPIAKPEIPKSTPRPELAFPHRLNSLPAQAKESFVGPRGLRYIRLREVCARVGLKQSTIYRLIGLGSFPKQIKLSEHASAWIESRFSTVALRNDRTPSREPIFPENCLESSPNGRLPVDVDVDPAVVTNTDLGPTKTRLVPS
jgi:predicted DNA-binding transcriptional regulator AlpA